MINESKRILCAYVLREYPLYGSHFTPEIKASPKDRDISCGGVTWKAKAALQWSPARAVQGDTVC